jgi:putative flippase GtrA
MMKQLSFPVFRIPRTIITQFLRFAGVGAIGTAVQYAILTVLVELAGIQPTLASGIGFVGGAFTNYYLNYRFTFQSERRHWYAAPRFFTIAAAGLGLNTLFMTIGTGFLGLHYLIAQCGSTAIVLLWNFSASKLWVFREAKPETKAYKAGSVKSV